MKFFFKCAGVFIGLWILLILLDAYWLHIDLAFSGIVLYAGVISIAASIFYGWMVDSVIGHRQPGLDDN